VTAAQYDLPLPPCSTILAGDYNRYKEAAEAASTAKEKSMGEDKQIFDLERMNPFVLRKQHLADNIRGEDIVAIAGDIGGLHATSAITPYLSLLARTDGFSREQLDEELYSKKTLGKVRGVRGTVYIYPREMIPVAWAANRRLNVPHSERFYRNMDSTEEEYEQLSRRILALLPGRGMTAAEIKRELGEEKSVSRTVNLMCDYGLLIRGAPAGGWRSNVHTYHLFEEYMPGVDLAAVDEKDARVEMVRFYLTAFGPAGERDIAWWTAFRITEVRSILRAMGEAVTRVRVKDIDGDLFILPSDVPELEAAGWPKSPRVSLLPLLDPYLMAYRDRDRYLPQGHYAHVYDRSGNATNCILLDGRITGVWDYDDKPPALKFFLFEKASRQSLQEIEKQALRMGEFLSGSEVKLDECKSMIPLTERTAGGFMTPLKNQ